MSAWDDLGENGKRALGVIPMAEQIGVIPMTNGMISITEGKVSMSRILHGMHGDYEVVEESMQGTVTYVDDLPPNLRNAAQSLIGQKFQHIEVPAIHADVAPENQSDAEAIAAGIRAAEEILKENPKNTTALNFLREQKGDKTALDVAEVAKAIHTFKQAGNGKGSIATNAVRWLTEERRK